MKYHLTGLWKLCGLLLLTVGFATWAQAAPRHEEMDYGPFLSGTFETQWPAGNTVLKGVAIRLDAAGLVEQIPEGPIGGGAFSLRPTKDVQGADLQDLYKTQRFRLGGYQLEVPNGEYKVTMKFADCWQNKPGVRVFDVLVQGEKVLEKLDLVAKVGAFTAFDHVVEKVRVNDGKLRITFHKHQGEPSIGAILVEGPGFVRKLNCGGEAVGDFAGDWTANTSLPPDPNQAGVLFDTELCRYAAAWTGGYLKLQGVVFDGEHGKNPAIQGQQLLATRPLPGVLHDGQATDPRSIPHGPLPRSWAKYRGLYRHQDGIVLAYAANGRELLDQPKVQAIDKLPIFTRTINAAKGDSTTLVVVDVPEGKIRKQSPQLVVITGPEQQATAIVLLGDGKLVAQDDGRVLVNLPPDAAKLTLAQWSGNADDVDKATAAMAKVDKPHDLAPLCKGGPSLWPETVRTQGKLADPRSTSAYVVDSLTLPEDNPYRSWMRVGGFDFLPQGKAALCTWSGDVWICSGIDDQLQKLTWRRYAAGLFHALGLVVKEGKIYVLGRDQITRLHDLNDDGEADFYECFNNDVMITENFHEFAYELQTDRAGNFYFSKGGPVRPGGNGWDKIVPHHGCLLKVTPDGEKLEVVARGFRAPNGIGIGPQGELTVGDNEGTWTPTVPLNWIRPGGFYGVQDFADRSPKPTQRDNPLCWFPKDIDNSNGGQVWITSERFGPLSGQMLHLSYGACTLFSVLKEDVAGQMQGGVVPLPLAFDSGICRARFHKEDNALYLTGLRGWQTRAAAEGGFYRVRYTGQPYLLPTELHVTPGELTLRFAEPLDRESVEDIDNYAIEQWNYRWTSNYGSPHVKVSDPKQEGYDDVEIDEAVLSDDGRTIVLRIPDLAPVMQMKTTLNVQTATGKPIKAVVHQTINAVGNLRGEVHVGEYRVVETK